VFAGERTGTMNGANNDDGGKTLGPPLLFPSLFFLHATTQRSHGYWTRKVMRVEGEKNARQRWSSNPIGKGEVMLL